VFVRKLSTVFFPKINQSHFIPLSSLFGLAHCWAFVSRKKPQSLLSTPRPAPPPSEPTRTQSPVSLQVHTQESAQILRKTHSCARLLSTSMAQFAKCVARPCHFNLLPFPPHQRNLNCAPPPNLRLRRAACPRRLEPVVGHHTDMSSRRSSSATIASADCAFGEGISVVFLTRSLNRSSAKRASASVVLS
jgi:hypothetical protein